MHHRNPTSSDNKLSQTHPIFVSNGSLKYDYYVIHNGMISNSDELRENHEKLGFIYNTTRTNRFSKEEYNDSESLAIETAMYIEKQTKEMMIEGSAAFIVVQTNKKTQKAVNIFFGRKDNPLKLAGRQGEIRLSSEGKGEEITEDMLYCFNIKSPSLTKTNLDFTKPPQTPIYKTQKKWDWDKKENKTEKTKEIEKTKKTMEITTKEMLEIELEIISDEFSASSAEIIEKFTEKLQEQTELNQMDIESEKKTIAIELITNMQKSYNLAIDEIRIDAYEEIKTETEKKIEIEEKKEENILIQTGFNSSSQQENKKKIDYGYEYPE